MRKRPMFRPNGKMALEAYLFLLPWLFGVVLFAVVPLYQSFIVTFTDAKYPKIFERAFVGFDNYKAMLSGVEYFREIVNVMQNVVIDIPLIVIFSLIIAVLLNQSFAGKGFFRTVFMLPILLSSAVVDYMTGGGTGAEQNFFAAIGGGDFVLVNWIGADIFERFGLIMWRTSVQILIFLAALQTIPVHLYEASQIDGATKWEMFWRITIPFMTPISLVVIIYTFIDAFTEPNNPLMFLISERILWGSQFALPTTAAWVYLLFTYLLILFILFVGSKIVKRVGI